MHNCNVLMYAYNFKILVSIFVLIKILNAHRTSHDKARQLRTRKLYSVCHSVCACVCVSLQLHDATKIGDISHCQITHDKARFLSCRAPPHPPPPPSKKKNHKIFL